jgi:hypothetical protein
MILSTSIWVAMSGRWVAKSGRWVAKLVERLLVTAALWIRKIQNGHNGQHTVARQKKKKKNILRLYTEHVGE